jgi:hypothetical protein
VPSPAVAGGLPLADEITQPGGHDGVLACLLAKGPLVGAPVGARASLSFGQRRGPLRLLDRQRPRWARHRGARRIGHRQDPLLTRVAGLDTCHSGFGHYVTTIGNSHAPWDSVSNAGSANCSSATRSRRGLGPRKRSATSAPATQSRPNSAATIPHCRGPRSAAGLQSVRERHRRWGAEPAGYIRAYGVPVFHGFRTRVVIARG